MPCTPPRTRSSRARTGWSESARESSPDRRTPASIPGRRAAASGGFLADMVRRWNARRGGSPAHGSPAHGSPAHGARRGHARRQPRDWRDGLLRPALAIACVVFAIGVALAVAPLRQAFLHLSSAVGITSHSSTGVQGAAGSGQPMSSSASGISPSSHPQQPGQRDGDRVPVEFFAVPLE